MKMAQIVTKFPAVDGVPVSNKRINLWSSSLYITYLGPISNVALIVEKGISYPNRGSIYVQQGRLEYKGGFIKNAQIRNMTISADSTGLKFVGTLYVPTLTRPNKQINTIVKYSKGSSGAGFKSQL